MVSIIEKKYNDYRRYFASDREFRQTLATYSPKKGILKPPAHQFSFTSEWPLGGVPLGSSDNGACLAYVDRSEAHTLVVGPTGSKKSRLVIMPMVRILGHAGESMIVCDPKGEIYQSSYESLRKLNYSIKLLDLRNPENGECWNPFAVPYSLFSSGCLDASYAMVNDIATNLIHRGISTKDPFWDYSAGQLFYGLALLLFRRCNELSLPHQYASLSNLVRLRNWLFGENQIDYTQVTSSKVWSYINNDLVLSSALMGALTAPERTRGSILATFDSKLQEFLTRPSLLGMLSNNTVDIATFRNEPTAVFLILPDEKTSHHGLASLFIKQTYEMLIGEYQSIEIGHTARRRINYVLDEFSSLPTISDFPAMMTASRSRGIRFTLVIQSKHQLILRYREEAETIMTNCGNWIFLTSRELNLLHEISTLCGDTLGDRNRPVLSISDLQRFDKERGEALILRDRYMPYLTRLIDIEEYGLSHMEAPVPKRKSQSLSFAIDFNGFMSIYGNRQNTQSSDEGLDALFDELFGTEGASTDNR